MSDRNSTTSTRSRKGSRLWLLLLALPYASLCFPAVYARATPALWGFPFFYWYQFAWVLITSAILGLVYKTFSKTSE
jgi:membrane protein implicated in regulation of membrane protease activity